MMLLVGEVRPVALAHLLLVARLRQGLMQLFWMGSVVPSEQLVLAVV
jgi:hypothetical protein